MGVNRDPAKIIVEQLAGERRKSPFRPDVL